MKNTIVILSLLFAALFSHAQSEAPLFKNHQAEIRLKVSTEIAGEFEDIWKFDLAPLIPAIQYRSSKGHLHQLELLNLSGNLDVNTAPIQTDGFAIAVRYEFAKPLMKNQESAWMPYLGVGLLHSHNSWIFTPVISSEFPLRYSENLSRVYIVPSAQYEINDQVFLDFALPWALFSLERNREVNGNPGIPIDDQITVTNTSHWESFSYLNFRFGIGIRL
ncbi:MAG: hypothetical protein AAFY45_15775 [Bacteroidota bacterium]